MAARSDGPHNYPYQNKGFDKVLLRKTNVEKVLIFGGVGWGGGLGGPAMKVITYKPFEVMLML